MCSTCYNPEAFYYINASILEMSHVHLTKISASLESLSKCPFDMP